MPTVLEGVTSNQTISVRFVKSIADTDEPKLATEINAATSVAMECLIVGTLDVTSSVERKTLRRMCERQGRERSGQITYSVGDTNIVYDPQDLAADISKGYAALSDGETGYLVERRGVHIDTAWAIGDLVRVIPVEVAANNPATPEDDDELQATISFSVIGTVKKDVALVA